MIQYDFNRKSKFEYIRFQIQTNKILSATNGMFFQKQVMMIFNRSIGIKLKSRILSHYFQIQNLILGTLPGIKYKKSSQSIIYFNVNPYSP